MLLLTLLKTAHVLSVVLFLGAGCVSAYYKLRADASASPLVRAWVHRELVRADTWLTLPAVLALPVTGVGLVVLYGLPWTTPWVLAGLAGYGLATALWLVAVRLQLRLRRLADDALRTGVGPGPEFARASRQWAVLGVGALAASLLAVWAMVSKSTGWPA